MVMPTARLSANASSWPTTPWTNPPLESTSVPSAMSALAPARRPWSGMLRSRAKRMADTTAPAMMTTAATPLPTAARIRGNAPNTSLPTGMAVPCTVSIGALSNTPAAKPLNSTRPHSTRRAVRSATSR